MKVAWTIPAKEVNEKIKRITNCEQIWKWLETIRNQQIYGSSHQPRFIMPCSASASMWIVYYFGDNCVVFAIRMENWQISFSICWIKPKAHLHRHFFFFRELFCNIHFWCDSQPNEIEYIFIYINECFWNAKFISSLKCSMLFPFSHFANGKLIVWCVDKQNDLLNSIFFFESWIAILIRFFRCISLHLIQYKSLIGAIIYFK